MTGRRIGFWLGLAAFALTLLLPPPGGMPQPAWYAAGLVVWMAAWWMTEAIPLYATALLPFIVLPLTGVADANTSAAAYYSPIIFLFTGGAFLALAIERTGLHTRLALFIMHFAGARPWQLLLGVMMATAILSMVISNTSTALIMMPMGLAILAAGGVKPGDTRGMAGALPMGIAFAASIGGLGTMIGTPTNALAVGLNDLTKHVHISFHESTHYGMTMVLL
jgi:sodium-dependent dicarboxylate transporter 2/3/5